MNLALVYQLRDALLGKPLLAGEFIHRDVVKGDHACFLQ